MNRIMIEHYNYRDICHKSGDILLPISDKSSIFASFFNKALTKTMFHERTHLGLLSEATRRQHGVEQFKLNY